MHVIEKCVRGIRCLVVGQDASEETFSDSPAELRLMHVIEKCVRGILCMVIGQDACEETFSDSPAELRLMHVIEKCVRCFLFWRWLPPYCDLGSLGWIVHLYLVGKVLCFYNPSKVQPVLSTSNMGFCLTFLKAPGRCFFRLVTHHPPPMAVFAEADLFPEPGSVVQSPRG